MATSKIPLIDNRYFGTHFVRAIGVAESATSILVPIQWMSPKGTTPTVSDITNCAVTGIGDVTGAVDSTRTNENTITFKLTTTGLTANKAYLCQVRFTLA